MKTLLNSEDYQQILKRLNSLDGTENRLWGKLSESQMLEHCRRQIEMEIGCIPTKAMFPAPIQWLAKVTFGYYIPWPRNLMTANEMIIEDESEFQEELNRLKETLHIFMAASQFHPHSIFGSMSKQDWGKIIYKHLDHHLKQFGR